MNHPGSEFISNPKIAKVLKEAIDSPLGSTKRKAAKQLIAIIRRTSSSYAGQGGPGASMYSPTTPGSSSYMTKAPRKDRDFSNMIVFPSPPAPRRGKPMTKAMTPPGQQGTSQQQQETASLAQQQSTTPPTQSATTPASNYNQYSSMPDISSAFSNVKGPTSPSSSGSLPGIPSVTGNMSTPSTSPSASASNISQTVSSALSGLSGKGGPGMDYSSLMTPSNPSSKYSGLFSNPTLKSSTTTPASGGGGTNILGSLGSWFSNAYNKGNQELYGKPQNSTPAPSTPAPAPVLSTPAPSTPAYNATSATTKQPIVGSITDSGPAVSSPASSTGAAATSGSTTDTTGSQSSTGSPSSTTDTTDTTKTGPTDTTKTGASDISTSLQSGINNNMGATAWAQSVMGNQDLLNKIFPGQDVKASPSLTAAVSQLQETLKNQYDIKGLTDQVQNMINNGVTVDPMLTTYIQNKDVSLDAIHKQIQNANEQMLHVDQGNPYEVSIWNQYSSYLNNLYTAQNASYADFFNKSTKMYSDALTAANTELTTAMNQYNNELTLDTNLTETDYNTMKQSLSDMYTAAQNAPLQEVQLATLKAQLSQLNASLVGAGANTSQGDLSAIYKAMTDAGILFDNKTETGSASNSAYGVLMSDDSNIAGMIQTIQDFSGQKVNAAGALDIISQAFEKTLQNQSGATAVSTANKLNGMVVQAVSDGVIPQATGLSMAQNMSPSISNAISYYVANTTGASQAAKNAFSDAFVGSGHWIGGNTTYDQTSFSKKYSATLGKDLTDAIFQSVAASKTALSAAPATATGDTQSNASSVYPGLTTDQIYQKMADYVNSLATPQAVGDYTGQAVSGLIIGPTLQALNQVGGS